MVPPAISTVCAEHYERTERWSAWQNGSCNHEGGRHDGRLEQYMYDLLVIHGIRFEFQKRYTLLDGFLYNGEAVRPITYTADFWLPDDDFLIDTKGFKTQQGVLRIKLLKHLFATHGLYTRIAFPKDKASCEALIMELLNTRMSSYKNGVTVEVR